MRAPRALPCASPHGGSLAVRLCGCACVGCACVGSPVWVSASQSPRSQIVAKSQSAASMRLRWSCALRAPSRALRLTGVRLPSACGGWAVWVRLCGFACAGSPEGAVTIFFFLASWRFVWVGGSLALLLSARVRGVRPSYAFFALGGWRIGRNRLAADCQVSAILLLNSICTVRVQSPGPLKSSASALRLFPPPSSVVGLWLRPYSLESRIVRFVSAVRARPRQTGAAPKELALPAHWA